MRLSIRQRRTTSLWLLATLLLSQWIGVLATPQLVLAAPAAQATPDVPVDTAALDATSADPNEEIIYVDENGVIRVVDTDGDPLVRWFSPQGGWDQVALGDINDDGDLEIVAVNADGETVRWAVFDPVVALGGSADEINGIPWATLYEAEFPGIAQDIYAGNYDPNIPGDEIVVLYQDTNDEAYIKVFKADSLGSNGKPTGREWIVHVETQFEGFQYSAVSSAQFDEEGAEDIILIDEDSVESSFDIYAPDQDLARLDGKSSDNDEYRQVAVGQAIEDGGEEVAFYLSVDRADKRSVIVYEWNEDDSELGGEDDWEWAFAPQPEMVFFADINGNGDEELFILRDYPAKDGIRLIMRDEWGDDRERYEDEPLELNLLNDDDVDNDEDNPEEYDYNLGAGGDIDGDDRDEVILIRENNIRMYTRIEGSNPESGEENFELGEEDDFPVSDENNLLVGDLDSGGFIEGPQFIVDKQEINIAVPTGTQSGIIQFTVNTTAEPISFNITQVGFNNWLNIQNSFATTPATINLQFDARNLPVGTYAATLQLRSNQNVLNQPYEIDIELTVEAAELQINPTDVTLVHYPCSAELQPVTTEVRVGGTNDLNFRAAVIGVPAETAAAAAAGGDSTQIVTGGQVDGAGNMVIYLANGETRNIGNATSASAAATNATLAPSAVLTTSWTIDPAVTWISDVVSLDNTTPSTLRITADPTALGPGFERQEAVLVLVADTRAGSPPNNVAAVPLRLICANGRIAVPLLP